MSRHDLKLGIFTTDQNLVVTTWDAWMATATSIGAAQALGRPLVDLFPDLEARGSLDVMREVLAHGTIQVMAPAFHHFLFECPPTVASNQHRAMQQHVTIGPLRLDDHIVGLVVTVEDVTSRIEQERKMADELQHIESLTRLLGQDDWRTRRDAVATLAQQGGAVVDALVRTLRDQHENLNVLSSALDLLTISDVDVIDPLVRCLGDPDVNLRIQAALILGERRDRRAIPALVERLDDSDANVRFHAIEALTRLNATAAAEKLLCVAETRDFFLAFPALHALSRLGNAVIAPRLVPLLSDELLRGPAIEALGELGDEDVCEPLVDLLNSSDAPTEVIADALAGLHDRYESRYQAGDHIATLVRRAIKATGTQNVLDAVQRVGPDRLRGLATILGWLEGEAAQRALTRLLGHDAVRPQVVEALVRNGNGVVALLSEQLAAEDLDTRQAAAVALGRIGDRRATPDLIAALHDRELSVSIAGALARIGDSRAFEPLLGLLGDEDAAVRQAAVAALNSIGHPGMPARIAELLGSTEGHVRESALKVAGYFGYAECLDRVLDCARDPVEGVRRTAVEQLPFFEEERAVSALIECVDDPAPVVRAAAASGLGRVNHPMRLTALLRALDDADSWVRYVALRSLAAGDAPDALQTVLRRLENDPAPHVRIAAVEVVARFSPARAMDILAPLTRSGNDDLVRAAIRALGLVDRPEALDLLEQQTRAARPGHRLAAIEALTHRGEPQVAEMLQWAAATGNDAAVMTTAIEALFKVAVRGDGPAHGAIDALIGLTSEATRRQAAIDALSRLPARCIDHVTAGLRHASSEVRRAAVEALSRMKHPDASRAVEAALDDGAAPVRLAAVAELKHLGSRTSARKLIAMARTDPDAEVRRAAMLAAAHATSDHTGGPGAIETS